MDDSRMILFFDMLAGLGGFRFGLEKTGFFQCVGWCEIDKYAQKAYRTLHDTKGEYFCDDARKIIPGEMPDFDVLCGGFPCQSFSLAGKRLGFDDTRGTLFYEIARVASVKRSSFLLLENVPGLLSHDSGRTFETILRAFHELGYALEWCVLNSAAFGVPQQRKRLFIVGSLGGRCTGQIFPVIYGNAKAVEELPECEMHFIDMNTEPKLTEDARCITARQDSGISNRKGEHSGVFIDLNENPKITEDARCIHTRMDLGVVGTHKGERSGVLVEDAPRAVLTPERDKVRQRGRRMKEPNEAMFTITAMDKHGVFHHGKVRRLMPIECFRLQGYTDEEFNKLARADFSDGRLYKMAGNSVTVPVISAIGRKIQEVYNA